MKHENFDHQLSNEEQESEVRYFAKKMGEAEHLPKYRFAVKTYSKNDLAAALHYAENCRDSGKLKKTLAAAFWWKLGFIKKEKKKKSDGV